MKNPETFCLYNDVKKSFYQALKNDAWNAASKMLLKFIYVSVMMFWKEKEYLKMCNNKERHVSLIYNKPNLKAMSGILIEFTWIHTHICHIIEITSIKIM